MQITRGKRKTVICVAWTGIAAILLKCGQTAHSAFKLKIPQLDESVNMNLRPKEAELLREATLIIWDEASMAPNYALNAVDKLLRDVMESERKFGGKVMALSGDFRQVLPVVRHGSRAAVIVSCLKKSSLWPLFSVLHLTTSMRAAPGEQEFADWLL